MFTSLLSMMWIKTHRWFVRMKDYKLIDVPFLSTYKSRYKNEINKDKDTTVHNDFFLNNISDHLSTEATSCCRLNFVSATFL